MSAPEVVKTDKFNVVVSNPQAYLAKNALGGRLAITFKNLFRGFSERRNARFPDYANCGSGS